MKKHKHQRVPDSIKGTGFYTPMDIAPGEYDAPDYPVLKKAILARLAQDWGPRCLTKDYEDFPELEPIFAVGDSDAGRCPCCLAYEKFDKFWEYVAPDEDNV